MHFKHKKWKPRIYKNNKTYYNKKLRQMERLKHKKNLKKNGKERFRLIPQRKALQDWFLTVPLNQIYSQLTKRVISNLKLKYQCQKRP